MLLIGLREFALSCSSAFFGLCFRCASVNALFCRAKPPNASFFSIFTRARPWGALKQTLRVRLRARFKIDKSKQTVFKLFFQRQRNSAVASLWRNLTRVADTP